MLKEFIFSRSTSGHFVKVTGRTFVFLVLSTTKNLINFETPLEKIQTNIGMRTLIHKRKLMRAYIEAHIHIKKMKSSITRMKYK